MDEREGRPPDPAEADALDEDPPTEAEFLRQLNESREPADDDPPTEPRFPRNGGSPGGRPSTPMGRPSNEP